MTDRSSLIGCLQEQDTFFSRLLGHQVVSNCRVWCGFGRAPDRQRWRNVITIYIPATTATLMPHYRIYVTTTDGHVGAPATVVECADDQEAIGKAAQLTNGKAVELWEGARFIVRFPSDED
jgi:hypothetical protein